ncbi:MAG: phosphoribosyltransferase [Thermoanaerobaculia bacterium]
MDPLNARFRDRVDAGRALARRLQHYAHGKQVLVLGLPRGGVVTAAEVAEVLGAPLDVLVIRKLGVPGHEELAMGAIGPGGVRVVNEEIVRDLAITRREIEQVGHLETKEQKRREALFRGGRPPLDLKGLTAILVDDGLATGATMLAAVTAARLLHAARVVVAVPVAAQASVAAVRKEADEVVCVMTGEPFIAVGTWYEIFDQTSDAEVTALLARHFASSLST